MNIKLNEKIIIYGFAYDDLESEIGDIVNKNSFIEVGSIGKSVMGKELYYIRLGKGSIELFINASHHSLEWITSLLLIEFIKNFLRALDKEQNIKGYDILKIFNDTSIYFVPMVNPDGVDIVLSRYKNLERFEKMNNTGLPLCLSWNANSNGVDLNRNYPADWELAKAQEKMLGIYGPGPTRFGGEYSASEPETIAVIEFVKSKNFKIAISYHTQGREIYWKYKNIIPKYSEDIVKVFTQKSGYAAMDNPIEASYAGFKDWFIQDYNRPGFTIEAGLGRNPLPISQFTKIYEENEEILLEAPLLAIK